MATKPVKEKTLKLKKGMYPVVNSEIAFAWSGTFGGFFWGIPGYGTADGFIVTQPENARALARLLNNFADAKDKLKEIADGKVPPEELTALVATINSKQTEGQTNA